MKTTVSLYDFRDAFVRAGRKDQFSYDALEIIYDYIQDQEQDLGEEFELDVIGLCCDIAEQSPDDIATDYSIDTSDCQDENEVFETVLDYLHDETTVIGTTNNGNIVYVQF